MNNKLQFQNNCKGTADLKKQVNVYVVNATK